MREPRRHPVIMTPDDQYHAPDGCSTINGTEVELGTAEAINKTPCPICLPNGYPRHPDGRPA